MERFMKLHTLLCLITITIVMYRCQNSTSPIPVASEKNTTVSGVVYQPDGTTPAVGARVMIRPVDALAVPTTGALGKVSSIKDTVLTGNEGTFSFDTPLETGIYMIEAMSDNNVVKIDSVEVSSRNEPVITPPATLRPAGAIRGSIVFPGECDPRNVFVLVFGIDRFTQVNDDGTFCFANLGSGMYSIRIISTMEGYGVFDVNTIRIVPADTTDLGAIILPQDGLPIPQNLTCICDTVLQQVMVRWNKCDMPNITGYALYRRLADSNELLKDPVILGSVDDTSIIDVSVSTGYRYEYRVAARGSDRSLFWVPTPGSDGYEYWAATMGPDGFEYREAPLGSDNGEGLKSDGVTVTVASYFTVDTIINVSESEIGNVREMNDMAVNENGDCYFTDNNEKCIKVFDRDMRFKRSVGKDLQCIPQGVKVAENGTVIVLNEMSTFYLFDSSGVLVDSIADSALIRSHVRGFDIKDSLIYCFALTFDGLHIGSQTFYVYTFTGGQIRAWQYNEGGSIVCILKGDDDKIYITSRMSPNSTTTVDDTLYLDTLNWIMVYDTLGTLLNQIPVPGCRGDLGFEYIPSIAYDDDDDLLYVTYNDGYDCKFRPFVECVIKAIDNSGRVMATYKDYEENGLMANSSHIKLLSTGELVQYICTSSDPKLVRLNPLKR